MNRLTCFFRSDFADLARIYAERLDDMTRFAEEVRARIEKVVADTGVEGCRVECRVKSIESFLEKVLRKNLNNPFTDCVDLIGVRVVYPGGEDRGRIEQGIIRAFECLERFDKMQEHGYKIFAYTAVHLHLLHQGRVFELQLRTLIQDTWARLDTLLFYKTGDTVPPAIRRKMNRLLALFEIADDEFESLREEVRAFVRDRSRLADETLRSMPVDLISLEIFQRNLHPGLEFVRENVDATVSLLRGRGVRTIGDLADLLDRTAESRRKRSAEMPEHAGRFDFHLYAALADSGGLAADRAPARANGRRKGV